MTAEAVLFGLTPAHLVMANLVVLCSAAVQSLTGSGFGILAAPLLLLVAASLVPGPLLVVTVVVMTLTLAQNRLRRGELRIAPAMVCGIPGAAIGVGLLHVTDATTTGVLIGVALVGLAAAALLGRPVPQTPATLMTAGTAGGVLAGLVAVPGPPLALVFRHESARAYRGNLAVYFLSTCAVSFVLLLWGTGAEALGSTAALGAWLLPGTAVGSLLALPLRGRVRVDTLRTGAFVLSGLAGLTVLVRAVLG